MPEAGWRYLGRLKEMLPQGRTLPRVSWDLRHRGILWLLAAHAVGLTAFGLFMRAEPLHAVLEGGIVGLVALVASWPRLGQRARSILASFGLMSCSAILTHLSGGYIEAHFHFFVMLGVIFLYEDWVPFLLSVAYVAVHHGLVGTLDPRSVFNHPAALASPWAWALVHATFIVGLSAALIVTWNVSERARRQQMAAQEEARGLRRQLAAQERMAALGSLASGLAHEVRTPLTVVATNASLIQLQARRLPLPESDPARAALDERVAEIHASVDRMNGLVLQLRRFARLEPEERRVAPLEPGVQEALDLFQSAHRSGVPVQARLEPTPPVSLHPLGLQQVVLNLVGNAVEAIDPTKGTVTVRTFARDDRAVLVVEDDGCGMDETVRARIFEPLFTTKPGGMGLGLSIVRKIVDQHGATVACETAPGRGARFTVSFPAVPQASPTSVPVLDAAPAAPQAAGSA